jgi:hypothetical protein
MKSLISYFQLPCKRCLVKAICDKRCYIVENFRDTSFTISACISLFITILISVLFLILLFKFCGAITFYIVLVIWGIIGFTLGLFILSDSDPNKILEVIFLFLTTTILGVSIIIFLCLNNYLIENLFD